MHCEFLLSKVYYFLLCHINDDQFPRRYVQFYGFPILVAQIDGVDAPNPPKCIALVYLYSDMWRSFDVGLYIYIHRQLIQ